MSNRRKHLAGKRLLTFLAVTFFAGACNEPRLGPELESTGVPAVVQIGVSRVVAQAGDQLMVAVIFSARAGDDPILGIQGVLHFDPSRLRYTGQVAELPRLAMVGDQNQATGELRLLSVDRGGLQGRIAVLGFDVLESGFSRGLRFEFTGAATQRLNQPIVAVEPGLATLSDWPSAVGLRRLGLAEWTQLLAPNTVEQRVPGQIVPGLRYGDITLNGSINVADVAAASNVSVGSAELLTNATRDVVIAGDVAPFNPPGMGEPGDPTPPGQQVDGSHVINVVDVIVISNESVGMDQPVAGELIPGRTAPLAADRRVIVTGTITSDRTFFRDSVYELQGTVNVPGSVTLTIQSGTLVEGDVATRGALSIRRGGDIHAVGTRLQPIIFSCTAATKTPGCWGGISVNGFSLLNNDDGVGAIGCPEKEAPGGTGIYGGCLIEDGSGMIRYVRIEYAGMAPVGGQAVAGLALLGAGSGTVVDSVQVHASLGDGIFVSGGTVNLRNLLLTANSGSGLRWDDGWVGKVQFLAVQQWIGGPALRGSNYTLDPDAGPRSSPQIYQATLIGPSTTAGGGVFLDHGSALTLRDAIVLQAGTGLDIDGAETCVQTTTMGIDVTNSIFFAGSPDFSDDDDCVDESAYALSPARANIVVDPQIKAPFNTLTPDLRPASGSPPETGYMSPPADFFFDTTQPFIGAIAPANSSASNVPWYAGWTRGWSGTP